MLGLGDAALDVFHRSAQQPAFDRLPRRVDAGGGRHEHVEPAVGGGGVDRLGLGEGVGCVGGDEVGGVAFGEERLEQGAGLGEEVAEPAVGEDLDGVEHLAAGALAEREPQATAEDLLGEGLGLQGP